MTSEPLDLAKIMAEHEKHRGYCSDIGYDPYGDRCLPYRLAERAQRLEEGRIVLSSEL